MNKFVCDCGKKYANKPNLCRHRRICTYDKKNVRIAELEQIIRVENNEAFTTERYGIGK